MPNLLFVKKSIEQLQAEAAGIGETHTLKRTLGAFSLVLLGIGAIIGAGLFSLTGIAAAHHAGPAVTLSYVLAAIGCAFAALCYAEFASMIPIAGSAYTYSYATMGELIAWIIGWDLVLEYAVGAATVAVSWSRYFSKLLESFGLHLPAVVMMSPFEHQTMSDGTIVHGVINLPAVAVIVIISLLLMRGTRESAAFNAFIVVLKVAVIITFIVLGWGYINPENYVPYIPPNTGVFGEFGWSGIFTGAAIVFFCVYRVRCCFHGSARSAQSPEGYANWDHRLTGDLHGALRSLLTRADGAGELQKLCWRSCTGRACDFTHAVPLAPAGNHHRNIGWLYIGDARDAAGAIAGVLLDFERWTLAACVFGHSPTLSDSVEVERTVCSVC